MGKIIFDIVPYTGAKPILFGMSRYEVHAILGVPLKVVLKPKFDIEMELFDNFDLGIGYQKTTVEYIVFFRGFRHGRYNSENLNAKTMDQAMVWIAGLDPKVRKTFSTLESDLLGLMFYTTDPSDHPVSTVEIASRKFWSILVKGRDSN